MKLRTKFVLVLLGMLVVLTGANLGALALYQDNIVAQETETVDQRADLTAGQIQDTVDLRRSEVGLYASKYGQEDLGRSGEYVRTFVDTNEHYVFATVMDTDGTVVEVIGPFDEAARQDELGSNYANEPYFGAAMNDRVSIEQQHAPEARDLIVVTAPLYGPDLGVVGVVRAAVPVSSNSFFPFADPLETNRTAVTVQDASGTTLYEPRHQFTDSITATSSVEGLDWEVTVSQDRSHLDQRLEELALLQGLSLLVVFASVLGFGVWEYRSNLKQTGRLLDAFERIKGGNYGHRLALETAEEWRQISDGFNDLARGLAIREAQLVEREQRLGVLNRVIRHNVRNEMSVILNYAQLIQETTSDDQAATAAGTIVDTGRKLADLSETARQIEEALESAEEGLVEQDLVSLVEGIVESARSEHEDVTVAFDDRSELTAAAIPSLQVAIENVVENAVVHNDNEDPRVEIALGEIVRDGEERVTLTVADNGPGIPEQEKNVLVQGHETALQHGSGLGLWLVYWVVDKSDGSLAFDENNPEGSIVTMELHANVPDDVTPTRPIESEEAALDPELPVGEDGNVEAD